MPTYKKLMVLLAGFTLALYACSPKSSYTPQLSFADALFQGDEQAVQYYLQQGENPNQLDENGNPFLLLAAANGNENIMHMMLDAKAFTDVTNSNGETALWTAASQGNTEAIKILLDAQADINQANNDAGTTPLMIASELGYVQAVEALINAGADLKAENKEGYTAYDLATDEFAAALEAGSADDAEVFNSIMYMMERAWKPLMPTLLEAIGKSDVDTVIALTPRIKTLEPGQQAKLLFVAAQMEVPSIDKICYMDKEWKPLADSPCITKPEKINHEANAEIMDILLDASVPSSAYILESKDPTQQGKKKTWDWVITTLADYLQQANPELLNTLLPRLDKCTLALSGMMQADLNKEEDWIYADYWRENNCSLKKMYLLGGTVQGYGPGNMWTVNELGISRAEELGLSKEALQAKLGEPNFVEHLNEFREILTYRRSEPMPGTNTINIVDDIYAIDHGVVTHRAQKDVALELRPYVDRAKIAKFENEKGY